MGMTLLVKVGDRVMVGVGDIVLGPVTLKDAIGVFFIVVALQGIFYHCNASK